MRGSFLIAGLLVSLCASTAFAADKTNSKLIADAGYKLTLAGSQTILTAAQAKAEAMKLNVNIAIVDNGGHLLAFIRMDRARPASAYTAMTKATAAATMRTATGPAPANAETADIHLSLSLQNAAAHSGGKMTTLKGGVPIVIAGEVIGAVGVGGGTGEQDAEVAKAGIAALMEAIVETGKP
ncbi:MAG TPA: heme-binding protein [Pirellulaceae bacterium]|nr:heme-binding protein [Pirellulaceae bacterium]